MGASTRTINLTRYLEALSQMPGVKPEDVSEAQNVFKKVLGDSYQNTTFSRGLFAGDGKITIPRVYASPSGPSGNNVSTNYILSEYGSITNEETGESSRLSNNLSAYFFAGIFGVDEMTKGYASSAFDRESTVAPDRLIKGLQDYYSCLVKTGSVKKCDGTDSGKFLLSERNTLAERKVMKERAEVEARQAQEAETARVAREQEIRAAEAARESARVAQEQQVNALNVQSENIWVVVEGYYDQARRDDSFLNSIRPKDLTEIMDRYRSYRFYTGSSDPLENSRVKVQKAVEMMRAVADNYTGWNYFKEACTKKLISREICHGDSVGNIEKYLYDCGDIVKKIVEHVDCRQPKSRCTGKNC